MRSETAGYGITDLTLRLTPHPEWEASATVYNMFDQKYGDPGASEHLQDEILQDRRTFRLRLEYWL
jgi:outer membrane receptor protein involved in Fe transport